jgi:hypothetical protein
VDLFVGEKYFEKFCLEIDFHVILETFYMPQICDMGQTALLHLRRKDFIAPKNPTASAGFEPANLGTKGQHATSRPPKPIHIYTYIYRVNKKHSLILSSYKIKTTWNILTKLVATIA